MVFVEPDYRHKDELSNGSLLRATNRMVEVSRSVSGGLHRVGLDNGGELGGSSVVGSAVSSVPTATGMVASEPGIPAVFCRGQLLSPARHARDGNDTGVVGAVGVAGGTSNSQLGEGGLKHVQSHVSGSAIGGKNRRTGTVVRPGRTSSVHRRNRAIGGKGSTRGRSSSRRLIHRRGSSSPSLAGGLGSATSGVAGTAGEAGQCLLPYLVAVLVAVVSLVFIHRGWQRAHWRKLVSRMQLNAFPQGGVSDGS